MSNIIWRDAFERGVITGFLAGVFVVTVFVLFLVG